MSDTIEIQACLAYHGADGITSDCIRAVAILLQTSTIRHARVVTSPAVGGGSRSHGFFFSTSAEGYVVVLPGFSSGYGGEGACGFSRTLAGLRAHDVPLDELRVDAAFFRRFRSGVLSRADVDTLASPSSSPDGDAYGYIARHHWEHSSNRVPTWRELSPPMPFGLIEDRLFDLAKAFRANPGEAVFTAFRRLEDLVRSRTGVDGFSAKLMSSAFLGDSARLTWEGIPKAEQRGRAQRFVSAFLAYRNPRAHKEPGVESPAELLREFLVINELYALEASSVAGTPESGEP